MSAKPTLKTYNFRVLGGDADSPTEHIVRGLGRDIQRTESLFADNRWGSTQDRPMTSAAAVCYFALNRTGAFPGTWKEFEDWYLSVEALDAVVSVPTLPGRDPGSP